MVSKAFDKFINTARLSKTITVKNILPFFNKWKNSILDVKTIYIAT